MKLKAIRRLCKSESGANAIEFAIALPVFLAFMFCCFEYAIMAFVDVQLNAGVFTLSRLVKTGQSVFSTSATPSDIKTALMSQLVPSYLFNANKIKVNIESFTDYSSIGPIEPCTAALEPCSNPGQFNDMNKDNVRDLQGGQEGSGNGSNVVLYTASYTWDGITPVWHLLNYLTGAQNAGGVTLSSSALVKSEPFPTTKSSR